MTVRELRREDLPLVAAVETACFVHPWSEKALELLLGEDALSAVCEEGGQILSYGGMTVSFDDGAILNIATRPDARRRGAGEAVLRFLLELGKQRGVRLFSLEVRESNESAIRLYEKLGFGVAGKRPRFYTCPSEAALVMTLTL